MILDDSSVGLFLSSKVLFLYWIFDLLPYKIAL